MARTELTLQTIDRDGIDPTYSAAVADGHAVNNASHKVFIHVLNGDASPHDVTITTPNLIDGLALADLVVSVPATSERIIGPFPHNVYCKNDTTLEITHAIWVDYSATTSVTIAALKLPDPTY